MMSQKVSEVISLQPEKEKKKDDDTRKRFDQKPLESNHLHLCTCFVAYKPFCFDA